MKRLSVLLATAGICAGVAQAGTVTLTRDDVASAQDIQMAIYTATHFGTTPGKVVFDGSKGPFAAAGANLDIKIPVSHLTLAGVHGATIASCSVGLAFADASVRHVLVEGMHFDCHATGDLNAGLLSQGVSDVTIRNNVFDIKGLGFSISGGSDWKIYRNVINSTVFDAEPAPAIEFDEVGNSEIVGNSLNAPFGITLDSLTNQPSSSNRIIANRMVVAIRGMRLTNATLNTVLLNHITLTSDEEGIGIRLDSGSSRNRVQLNKAAITTGGSLSTVVDNGTDNKVSGNRP